MGEECSPISTLSFLPGVSAMHHHSAAMSLPRLMLWCFVRSCITHDGGHSSMNTNFIPCDLRCEYRISPLSIDVELPRLNWRIESNGRGQRQTAYQILVASSVDRLNADNGDLWNSGKVSTDQTIHIIYDGRALYSRMECYWKVRVWDGSGRVSAYSSPALWRMGLLSRSDWKAQWIGLKSTSTDDCKAQGIQGRPAPLFRKEFTLRKKMKRTMLYATARGVYTMRLNGSRIGTNLLAPEWTDYNKRIQYQTYDVTDMLRDGSNCLGAIVGDGWYRGFIGYRKTGNSYGDQTGLLLQMHIEYDNGDEEIVTTDSTWKCTAGSIRCADLLMGEHCDARKDVGRWDTAGYIDDNWRSADILEETTVRLVAQPSEPVQITQLLPPQTMTEPVRGVYVFDLGQNITGFCRLAVSGPAGTVVTLRYAEMLNPDGTIYKANLRRAKATDTYVLSGNAREVFEPQFTFHGFRYVEVTGYPGTPTLDAIAGCAIHSALPMTGVFQCSDPLVNRLQSNITWSQRDNFLSIPTDCPQRDERLGWLGDGQIFVRTAAFNMDIAAFMTKWMVDIEDGQTPEGAFKDTSPYVEGFGGDGAPGWGDAGVIIPWTVYQCYGDTRIIERHYDAMGRWMRYISDGNQNYLRKNRLNNNYGDWLSVNADTPKDVLATAYWAYDALLMSRMAKAIGRLDDERAYKDLFRNIKAAFQREYVSSDGHILGNTQTCYALALSMDLVPEELREHTARNLVDDIMKRDRHVSTGFIGVKHLNPVLSEAGYAEVAYRLLNTTTYPSWGYPVKHGATTIWERWDGWTEEKGFQDAEMNSFNHYALGSVGEWLYGFVAGIELDPERPGYKHSIIHPHPGGGLTFARAEYRSIHGTIVSHWKHEDLLFTLDITIPGNTSATVFIPTTDGTSLRESSNPADNVDDIRFLRYEKGCTLYEVGSGQYSFTSIWKK